MIYIKIVTNVVRKHQTGGSALNVSYGDIRSFLNQYEIGNLLVK